MKTDDLINLLASGPELAMPPRAAASRTLMLGGAVLASALLMVVLLGVRHDLGYAASLPAFWSKLVFSAALALAGHAACARLAMPGRRLGRLAWWSALPVLLMWALAAFALVQAGPAERSHLIWGNTWRWCPLLITVLSLPVFGMLLVVMRGLAPTRLRLAGAACGLAAGATAATLYCLHCQEMSSVFVGAWYLLGMLVPAALGAMLGPRVLRW